METDYNDKNTTIRTDLWHQMTIPELINQQRLLIERSNTISSLVAMSATPSVKAMQFAVEMALNDINELIQSK